MKKKTALKILLFILSATKIFAASEKVQISQIKIIIDKNEYSWKKEGLSVVSEAGSKRLLPETVITYTNIKPGKTISLKALEREVKETELRIIASGLVYSAQAVIVPARKNPEKRTVLITIKSGFFYRFGGGDYYGVFGSAGLSGKRMEVLGFAGWNVNGVSWKYENAFERPLILGASLFWNGPAAFLENENYSSLASLVTTGFFLGADNRICVDVNSDFSFGKKMSPEKITIKPYVKKEKYFSEKLFLEICSQAVFYPFQNEKTFDSWDSVCSVNWTPFPEITFASSVAYGNGNCSLNGYEKGLSSNNCLSERVIRSGYSKEELICNEYFYSSFEARWNATVLNVSPIVKIGLQPFGFTDLAFTDGTFRNAFGGGTRILLDNPIFAYFTLCYGWNNLGEGRFIFTATKGF